MKISARNTIKATVKKIELGSINTEVVLEIAPGVEITAIIAKFCTQFGKRKTYP